MEAAGALLRTARRQARLSQAELARRAGVTQSVVSAYESGARQPSLPTLGRLIEAAGADLEVRVSFRPVARDHGALAQRAREHRGEILELVERFGLKNPRLFGSVARGQDKPSSDIDLLVDVPANISFLTLGRCQAELEALLGAPVDLVPAADLKAGLAGDVLAEAVPL